MRSGLVATRHTAGTTRGNSRCKPARLLWRPGLALVAALLAAAALHPAAQAQSFSAPLTVFPSGGGSNAPVSAAVKITVLTPTAISGFAVPLGFQNSPEFLITGQTGCTVDGTTVMQAGAVCFVSVRFLPLGPGPRTGTLIVTDGVGVPTAFGLLGTGYYPQVAITPGAARVAAGTGPDTTFTGVPTGDGGVATQSSLSGAQSVAADSFGNIYIADTGNNRIRMLDAFGNLTTVAGGGTLAGALADGQPATLARLNQPTWVAVDAAGNLYFSETGSNVIRRVAISSTGLISTVPTPALNGPQAIVFDNLGDLIFADAGNHIVRIIDAVTGQTSTLVGSGDVNTDAVPAPVAALSAHLTTPTGLAIDPQNNLYISDLSGGIRKLSGGTVTTFAGNGSNGSCGDGGPATDACLSGPAGLALTPAGDLYLANSGSGTVRKIEAATGIIETVAGVPGPSGAYIGGVSVATSTQLNGPLGLAFDPYQNLYIADTGNSVVRVISTAPGELAFAASPVGQASPPLTVKLANIGNAPLAVGSVASANAVTSTNFVLNNTGTLPCASTLATGTHCAFTVAFAPQASGFLLGELDIADNVGLTSVFPNLQPVYLLGGTQTPLAIGPATLPKAVVNYPYSQVISITGGVGAVSLDLSGTLPAGFAASTASPSPALTLSGTPTTVGDYPLAVYATDSLGDTTIRPYTLTVLPQTVTYGLLETVHVTDTPVELPALTLPVNETVHVTDTSLDLPTLQLNLAEMVHVADIESLTYVLTITESIQTTDHPVNLAGLILTVPESIGVTDSPTPVSGLTLTVPESIGVADNNPQTTVTGKRSQSITAPSVPGHTYGDATFTVAATSTSGLPVAVAVTSGPATLTGGALDLTGSGPVTLTFTQPGDANTLAAPAVTVTFTVAPAVATITARNAARASGQPNPAFSYTLSGLVHGDLPSVISGLPSLSTAASAASLAGSYPIAAALGTLSAANYTFTFVPGTLTVTTHLSRSTIFLLGNESAASFTAAGGTQSTAVPAGGTGAAVDANGYVWSIDGSGSGLAQFNSSGALTADYTSLGLTGASALAIDGNGQVWVANGNHSVTTLANNGTVVSNTAAATISGVTAIAIDASGSVWLANSANNTVDVIIGGAAPAAPLATALTNNTTGTRP